MVVPESEILSRGEADSLPKNQPFPLLGTQLSIYSLTLDEFQHILCDCGKNFGSMNMDEFLNSIWTAEENQAQAQNVNPATPTSGGHNHLEFCPASGDNKGISEQLSLQRQGSFTLPPPLCRKTVDEVWSEIHKSQQEQKQQSGGGSSSNDVQNPDSAQRQATFGEMTLEDFLIRAGVVREQGNQGLPAQQQQQYGLYQNSNNPGVGPSFVRPVMGMSGGGSGGSVNVPAYPTLSQGGVGGVGESLGYLGNGKRSGRYTPPQPPLSTVCYGGRVGNVSGGGSGGGFGAVQGLGMGSPVSPVSSDGMYMGEMRGGRKRILDGPVEKVVERRQRRMIKNRESAARSRARKQAYTVELEAELSQLKEENAQLKQALAELERKKKQQCYEEARMRAQTKAQRATEKLQVLRRGSSCPL